MQLAAVAQSKQQLKPHEERRQGKGLHHTCTCSQLLDGDAHNLMRDMGYCHAGCSHVGRPHSKHDLQERHTRCPPEQGCPVGLACVSQTLHGLGGSVRKVNGIVQSQPCWGEVWEEGHAG